MSTPRDLLITALDVAPSRPLEQGELSLALAGAELIDLLSAQAIALDGDHIVPGSRPAPGDRLLDEAASSVVRRVPYESVEDWLWRRGRGLSSAYLAALESEGQLVRRRRRLKLSGAGPFALADSPDRRRAADRRASGEPVLAALASSVGIHEERTDEHEPPSGDESPNVDDDGVATVLAAVNDALLELEAVRQRRAVEEAAFDNIWRGG
ncbi:GPP34 family phosphoprotein [Streptomyces sp. NPDC003077]|uniref:GOLPH3/VPS74 family protein n=1 Tax=Streptomyces sp. NPDC003077 TaxID=3154443 RepID=UPI0033B5CD71